MLVVAGVHMWRNNILPPTPEVAFRGVLHHLPPKVGESNDGEKSHQLSNLFFTVQPRKRQFLSGRRRKKKKRYSCPDTVIFLEQSPLLLIAIFPFWTFFSKASLFSPPPRFMINV